MINLSEERREALEEVFNIAFGLATSLISDSIDTLAQLHVPSVHVYNMKDLANIVCNTMDQDCQYYKTSQVFLDGINGESVFLMDENSAHNIARAYMQADGSDEEPSVSDIESCLLEITNIMTSACVGKVNELVETSVYFQPPYTEKLSCSTITENHTEEGYTKAIVVQTVLDMDEYTVKGYLLIMLKEESFDNFLKALDTFIEKFAG